MRSTVLLALIASLLLSSFPVSAAPADRSRPGEEPPTAKGVTLVASGSTGITLDVTAPAASLKQAAAAADGGACRDLRVAGLTATEEPGQPLAPVQIVTLGVPPGVDLVVETQELEDVASFDAGNVCVSDGKGGVSGAGDSAKMQGAEAAGDFASTTYPGEIVRLIDLGFARSQRLVRLEIMPVQVDAGAGRVMVHEHLRVAVHFRGIPEPTSAVTEEAGFEAAMRRTLLNYEPAREWRVAVTVVPQLENAWKPPQPAHRVLVKATGMTSLTRTMLADAGLPVETIDPRTFKLYNAGTEIAILVIGEGDGQFNDGDAILFYGTGFYTRYTDTNVYWLTYGGSPGRRMNTVPSLGGGAEVTWHQVTVRQEQNRAYVSTLPKDEGHDHWYFQPAITASGFGNPGRRDLSVATTQLDPGNHSAKVRVQLGGNVTGKHHLRLYVNGQQVHDSSWTQRVLHLAESDFPQSYLTEGASTVRVELVNDTPGQTVDQAYLDWVEVIYYRRQVAVDDALAFGGGGNGAQAYVVSGFTTASDLEVYDVTDPANVAAISNAATTPAGGGFTLRFAVDQAQERRFYALAPGRRLAPVDIVADQASDLQNPNNGADYVIVTHGDFLDAMQPLADLRAGQGQRVKVVDVQDIYDEFNSGMMSAEAIRDFLAYAYAGWQAPALRDVLLVGDGTYDMRRYLGTSAPTYLPAFLAMVDPQTGETASDNRFAAVAGTDIIPDLNVGRLPANTAAEATAMVDKILDYETVSPAAEWTQRVLFVSDNLEGGGGNFYELSDAIADGPADPPNQQKLLLPASYERPKVYLGVTCASENPSVACRNQIKSELENGGALMVSYIGHGTKTYWAVERLLDIAGVSNLQNAGRLPIMLPMTCDEGYFIEPKVGDQSTSEAGLRQAGRGTIASYAPTGFGLSSGHDYLERGLFQSIFHDRTSLLGAATSASKYYLLAEAPPGKYLDLIDTFLLMGDPALHLPLQPADKSQLFMPLQQRSR